MYRVTTDERSQPQIEALPQPAWAAFAELRVLLEVTPWSSDSINADNPDAGVRTRPFGADGQGLITFLILEELRRVDILDVLWIG